MRKLKTSDVPALCRCLKRLGLKDKFKTVAQESNNMTDVFDKGYDLIWDLFDKATEPAGEGAIYAFLAGPFEMTATEVRDLPLTDLMANMKQLSEENDLGGFFKSAARLMR